MQPTAAVTHIAAGFGVAGGPRLARVPIPTAGATQRQLTLEENVEGPAVLIDTAGGRHQAELLFTGERPEVTLQ